MKDFYHLQFDYFFSLIKNGIDKGIIDEDAIIESLVSLKRAGSNAIVSYFSLEVANQLK